jgi:L-ascorbate metabolism protein UlaG (beta-lactamase superfamily)
MTLRLCLSALLGFFVIGCSGPEPAPAGSPIREVRVDWLGQQSFRITSALGTKIITNPYAGGFPSNQRPDIVLITTERSDCNNVDAFDNTPTVFRGAVGIGTNNSAGLRIRGVPTYKNPEQESSDSMNLVFVWTLDGLKFCFLGHLRNELTSSQILQIGAVDVLFAPPGSAGAAAVAQLRPRVIIPLGRETFVPKVYRLPGSSVLLTRETLPAEQTALVFSRP